MYYLPPKRPKQVVLYIRSDPDYIYDLPAVDQERICRRYCAENGYPILRTVRVQCSSEDSLSLLRYLVRSLPESVDSLLAARFYNYSRQIPELSKLCLVFQCRKTWVYSLDVVGPLYKQLNVSKAEDYDSAVQIYRSLTQ